MWRELAPRYGGPLVPVGVVLPTGTKDYFFKFVFENFGKKMIFFIFNFFELFDDLVSNHLS